MPATHIKYPTEEDWASHREQLTRWYQQDKKPLHQVMFLMKETYGFVAKKNQYEKYLHVKWKLCKKTKSQTWKAIAPIVHDLERRGRRFELWIEGEKKSAQTIHKEIRRYVLRSDIVVTDNTSDRLPRGVIIKEIPLQKQLPRAVDLPSLVLERHFEANLPILRARSTFRLPSLISTAQDELTTPFTLNVKTFEALKVASLNEDDVHMASVNALATSASQGYLSLMDRNILFSLANNLAGLDKLSTSDVSRILQRQMTGASMGLIRSVESYPGIQAVARAIYQWSIVTQNLGIVQFLLSQSIPGIEANCLVTTRSNSITTPLNIAVGEQNADLVRLLLEYGADPKFSPWSRHSSSTLELLVFGGRLEGRTFDQELFELLVEKGAYISCEVIELLIRHEKYSRLIKLILFRDITSRRREWSSDGVFHRIFQFQDQETLKLILNIMLENGVDLNSEYSRCMSRTSNNLYMRSRSFERDHSPRNLIDIVSNRGDLVVFALLLINGAKTTSDTLLWAIRGGNEHLVQCLFDETSTKNRDGRYWDSAMAVAIMADNPRIIELIYGRFLELAGSLNAAMVAACHISKWDFFQHHLRLCHLPGKNKPSLETRSVMVDTWVLEAALSYSIHDGQNSIAEDLLDAGVSPSPTSTWKHQMNSLSSALNTGSFHVTFEESSEGLDYPLVEALKKRGTRMVNTLLDAGAVAGIGLNKPTLLHAAKWGDRGILAAIILNAGMSLDNGAFLGALNAVIRRKDRLTLDLLVNAGISMNIGRTDGAYCIDSLEGENSALFTAVRTCDTAMVDHVLQAGADPHDPDALHQAFVQSSVMFDLIMQKHVLTYPRGRKGWGGGILMRLIAAEDLRLFEQMVQKGADANEYLWKSRYSTRKAKTELDIQDQDFMELSEGASHPVHTVCPQGMTAFGVAIAQASSVGVGFAETLLQSAHITGCRTETLVTNPITSSLSTLQTAFLAAVATSHIPTIELLIRHNADVNFPARHNIKRTPLQQAAEKGDLDVVKLLLKHGADVNGSAAYKGGGTALQLAAIKGWIRITLLLLEQGAAVHAPASKLHGRTPLEGAAEHGRLDTVALLLHYYGVYDVKYEQEFTSAMAYAEKNGFGYITKLLREHQATGSAEFDEFLDFGSMD